MIADETDLAIIVKSKNLPLKGEASLDAIHLAPGDSLFTSCQAELWLTVRFRGPWHVQAGGEGGAAGGAIRAGVVSQGKTIAYPTGTCHLAQL
jgi:hypothetical protein